MPDLATPEGWLPIAFVAVMGLAMLAYVILDGFDLGIGILLRTGSATQRDLMIGSIGPFWDANETWLVLGVGVLLTVFPLAHGEILGALYLPVTLMLIGLILRGVAFDFRVKARAQFKTAWDNVFFAGSLLATVAQGFMLGQVVMGFSYTASTIAFSLAIGLSLVAGYCLLGAAWLIIKTGGSLQLKAVNWAYRSLWLTAVGIGLISIATPLLSERIFDKWFTLPWIALLAPVPLGTLVLLLIVDRSLRRLPDRLAKGNEYGHWVPFAGSIGVFLLAFYGLAYSLFPYLVIDQITIWQAATSSESMLIIFAGACLVLPVVCGYTILVYRVFRGKATVLEY